MGKTRDETQYKYSTYLPIWPDDDDDEKELRIDSMACLPLPRRASKMFARERGKEDFRF